MYFLLFLIIHACTVESAAQTNLSKSNSDIFCCECKSNVFLLTWK